MITDYATLQDAMSNWLNRSASTLAATPAELISLFEARMNRILRTPEMEADTTADATAANVTLPADFLQMRELRADGVAIPAYNPQRLRELYRNSAGTTPLGYAVVGNTLLLQPAPTETETVDVDMTYFQRIPALSDDNTTNWLLTAHPDLYLYGSLARATSFLRDDEAAMMWKATEDEILSEVMAQGVKMRLPAGPLVMRSGTVE